jgi:hypothetical protein
VLIARAPCSIGLLVHRHAHRVASTGGDRTFDGEKRGGARRLEPDVRRRDDRALGRQRIQPVLTVGDAHGAAAGHRLFLLVANHSAGIGLAELASFAALYLEQVGRARPLAGFAHPIDFRFAPIARRHGLPIVPMGIRGSHFTAPVLLRSRVLPWLLVLPCLAGLKRWSRRASSSATDRARLPSRGSRPRSRRSCRCATEQDRPLRRGAMRTRARSPFRPRRARGGRAGPRRAARGPRR